MCNVPGRSQVQEKDGGVKAGAVNGTNFKLRWREGEKAPCEMSRSYKMYVSLLYDSALIA